MSARAVAVACLLALAAGPRLAAARPGLVAAVLPSAAGSTPGADDVRAAVLIGPTGEVYQPGAPGTWTRRSGGGVAADVVGASAGLGELFVAGASTPLYRRRDGVWQAMRLGQRGAIVLGAGPLPAVAVGRHVFVQTRTGWTRVGQAPLPVTALWAAPERDVVVAAGGVLWRLRGGSWQRLVKPAAPSAIVGTGAWASGVGGTGPWALAGASAYDLARGRAVTARTPGAIAAATATRDAVWLLIVSGAGPMVLERHGLAPGAAAEPPLATPLPADASLAAMLVDASGRVLLATRAGAVHLWADGAWTRPALVDELPAPRRGAAPARSR